MTMTSLSDIVNVRNVLKTKGYTEWNHTNHTLTNNSTVDDEHETPCARRPDTEVISPCCITIPERKVMVQEHYVPCITIPERQVMVQRQYIPDRVRLGRI